MGHQNEMTNTQIIIRLVHLARFVFYLGLSVALWLQLFSWKPAPSIPGVNVMQANPSYVPTILATLATAIRGFLAKDVLSYKKRAIVIAAGFDAIELLLVVGFLVMTISYIIAFNVISSALVLSTVFLLSFTSFVLSLMIIRKE